MTKVRVTIYQEINWPMKNKYIMMSTDYQQCRHINKQESITDKGYE
jgi:hypothetical protein